VAECAGGGDVSTGSTLAFTVSPAPRPELQRDRGAGQRARWNQAAVALSVVRDTDPPRLALSATSQRFSALAGGADPEPQPVLLSNAGGGTLGTIQVGAPEYGPGGTGWLAIQVAGSGLAVSARTGTLLGGSYTASLRVSSTAGGTADLAVTFVVGSPRLTLTPRTVSFADTLAGTGPSSVTVSAANTGGGDLGSLGPIAVQPIAYGDTAAGWLTAALDGSTLSLTARTAGLAPRTAPYQAMVLVGSSHGGEDTVSVAFTVAPGGSPPRLALSLDSLRFTGLVGQPDPQPQTVSAVNAGGGVLGVAVADVAMVRLRAGSRRPWTARASRSHRTWPGSSRGCTGPAWWWRAARAARRGCRWGSSWASRCSTCPPGRSPSATPWAAPSPSAPRCS
jgi:hypothetical protein